MSSDGHEGEMGAAGEEGTVGHRSRTEIIAFLVLSVMLAVGIGWLGWAQHEATQRNHALILQSRVLILQIQQIAIDECASDARQSRSLRRTLTTLRDSRFVHFTAAEEAARIATYDRLLRATPVRNCKHAFSSLPALKRTGSSLG